MMIAAIAEILFIAGTLVVDTVRPRSPNALARIGLRTVLIFYGPFCISRFFACRLAGCHKIALGLLTAVGVPGQEG